MIREPAAVAELTDYSIANVVTMVPAYNRCSGQPHRRFASTTTSGIKDESARHSVSYRRQGQPYS